MFIIKKGNETQVVQSLDGYDDGWQTLGETENPPSEDEEWSASDKRFKVNKERKAKKERESFARNPIKMLERIEALEAKIEQLLSKE